MKAGILALQGDFEAHALRLKDLGYQVTLIKSADQLKDISLLAMPGGESTAMLKLLDADLKKAICERTAAGMKLFATCAGAILIAKKVFSPEQESLGLIDIDVERNSYGRQVDSFIQDLEWSEAGQRMLSSLEAKHSVQNIEGVFIRAPKIVRVGAKLETLLLCGNDPVLVRQDNIFAATFHPELSARADMLYALLGCHTV